ncbi:MAG TPA: glycosyltransferase [Terriglobales bacterium]
MSTTQTNFTTAAPALVVREAPGRQAHANLRVLTLSPFYPSVEDSSQGGFIAEPLSRMADCGITSEVIAVQPFYRKRPHSLRSEVPSAWRTYFSLPGNLGLPTSGRSLAAGVVAEVSHTHRKHPFDLIHAHSALPCGHAAAILSERLGIPFVVSVHGLDVFSSRQAYRAIGSWCKNVSERVYRSARFVICISEKVRDRVAESVTANAVVAYNGVDADFFHPESSATAKSKSALIVLSVGNLISIKGHALLLRAFARCVSQIPDCVLEIIGDGPERANLAHLAAEIGITDKVQFLGRRSREVVAGAMRRCDVFALPSRYEGLGCVYLEAMACAKPVIACLGQGIDELIQHGNNGWLVSPSPVSDGELADSLGALLKNPQLCQRLGNEARDTVLRQHTLAHQARRLADVYLQCSP